MTAGGPPKGQGWGALAPQRGRARRDHWLWCIPEGSQVAVHVLVYWSANRG
jgi:hypothetical protein